jgi:hypothetical protein
MDDPFVDNTVNCNDNSIMEDGDPLEGNANYGAYPYSLKGFTYHLQSLVFIGYFGAPKTDSVHSWLAFQNDESHVCPGQSATTYRIAFKSPLPSGGGFLLDKVTRGSLTRV